MKYLKMYIYKYKSIIEKCFDRELIGRLRYI